MKYAFVICCFILPLAGFANPQDSIGVKKENGKTYIMHKISKGEGVYGISKKYGVKAEEVFEANPGSKEGIKMGAVLLIPAKWSNSTAASSGSPAQRTEQVASVKKEKLVHVVEKGQTLSLIARKYNVSVDQLKSWNNLKSDNINLGQKLTVGERAISTGAPVKTPDPIKSEPAVVRNEPVPVKEEPVTTTAKDVVKPAEAQTATASNNTPAPSRPVVIDDGDEVTETGKANISTEGDLSQERNFVQHPTAKVGTIVMITNPENNKAVFARVVSNCKSTDQGTVLKMSKTVAEKLGADDNAEIRVNYAR